MRHALIAFLCLTPAFPIVPVVGGVTGPSNATLILTGIALMIVGLLLNRKS